MKKIESMKKLVTIKSFRIFLLTVPGLLVLEILKTKKIQKYKKFCQIKECLNFY